MEDICNFRSRKKSESMFNSESELMNDVKMLNYVKDVLANLPTDWLVLTTHRLDIYNEKLAKTQFLEQFEELFNQNDFSSTALSQLSTAFDYIRLGHPLSCLLEWLIGSLNDIDPENVISFSSRTVPVLAILRKNLLDKKRTQIAYTEDLQDFFDMEILRSVYGYHFDLIKVEKLKEVPAFDGSTIFFSKENDFSNIELNTNIDFFIGVDAYIGSVLLVNGEQNKNYIADIQHVRRRESIAMTPSNCYVALESIVEETPIVKAPIELAKNKGTVIDLIKQINGVDTKVVVGSSGLSIQYAIMMGLIHAANENHPGKPIKIVVPPNCYGGTNDQARRVAACLENVAIVDLPVDGDNDMVESIDTVLNQIAAEDAVPYIIAEIPTNPRVEVPDLINLRDVLSQERFTSSGGVAVDPVFILDQTFCPNVHFLGEDKMLSTVRTISYASGSKFPSGGKCTAGYSIGNTLTEDLMDKVALHLDLCDNEATILQYDVLSKQLPSMNQRIEAAYKNARGFVNYVHETLPEAKINFVSEELAQEGFTPSVFSIDLPTRGNTAEEKDQYKREMNLKLINKMINEIPNESKFCVSYGQLKGCYWAIPATSTQGTTKEGDKDYIVRVALSPNMDLELHKKVFGAFVEEIKF